MWTPSINAPDLLRTSLRDLAEFRLWVRENAGQSLTALTDAAHIDQRTRWEQGERIPAETYLHILTDMRADYSDSEYALDLIYSEFLLRCDRGDSPKFSEYAARFPAHTHHLQILLDLDQQLEGESPTTLNGTAQADTWDPSGGRFPGPLPRVKGYEVQEEVGRGGMGVVYRAHQPALKRTVALKLVPVADAEAWARFRVEAEAVAELQHPNIVQLFEIGEADDARGGSPYMALEFVEGGSLARRLGGKPMPSVVAAELLKEVAGAVHFAHQRGILHRDLKPANILLKDEAGSTGSQLQPKVSDFGLAKRLDGSDAQTRTGSVLGTPAYMAPEQLSGRNRDVGTPTDVYALGAILYECLTGRPPFHGTSPLATLERVRSRDVISPRRLQPGVPRDLETICLKCLQKEPDRRYASAAALAEDLARFLAEKPIRASRVGPLRRAALWCRRNPTFAGAVAAGVLAVVVVAAVGVAGVVFERDRYRGERDQARTNLYRALVGETRALMKARDTAWWTRAMDNLREASRLDVPSRDASELRNLVIDCMGTEEPCFRQDGTWAGHEGAVTAMACRPDGQVAASGSRDRTVRLWSVPDGRPIAVLAGHAKTVTGVAFAPDGRHLASCSADGTVRFWDTSVPDRPPIRLHDPHAGSIAAVAYSPDGLWLAAACADGTIHLFPTAADQPEKVLTGHTGAVNCLAFSELGELASGGEDLTIRFWYLPGGTQTRSWPTVCVPSSLMFSPLFNFGRIAWGDLSASAITARDLNTEHTAHANQAHSGGVTQVRHGTHNLWLTASTDGSMKLFRQIRDGMSEVALARGEFGPVHSVAMLPNAGGVMAGYGDGRVRFWWIEEPPQRAFVGHPSHHAVFVGDRQLVDLHRLTDLTTGPQGSWRNYTPSSVRALAMDPAGSSLALGRDDGTLETWSWPSRREHARWPGHSRKVTSLAAGPDGRFASSSADGTVKLWRWDAIVPDRTFEPGLGEVFAVSWGADGRYLAAAAERGVVLWDLKAGNQPQILSRRILPVGGVAIGPNAIAFSANEGAIELRNLGTGSTRLLRGHAAPVEVLSFSPDGTRLASSANDETVRVWDPATGDEIERLKREGIGHTLAFDRSSRYLLCKTVRPTVFDLRARHATATLVGVNRSLTAMCFSADVSDIVVSGDDGSVIACPMSEVARTRTAAGDPASAVLVVVPPAFVPGGHAHGVWGIAVSPNRQWVATAGHDGTVKLWSAPGMNLVRTLEGHKDIVWSVAFSPDSRFLASGSGDIRIWEVETGRQVSRFKGNDVLIAGLAFHPHRPWLVSGAYDGTVRLWDVARGEPLGQVHKFESRVHDLAFRPDGRWLAAAIDDFTLAMWEVGEKPLSGPPDRLLVGHTSGVRSVAFSPDGRTLASGADQGVVLLWDGETFEKKATMRSGKGQIRGLAFSSDGDLLAAAGYTVSTVIWNLTEVRRTLREMNLD